MISSIQRTGVDTMELRPSTIEIFDEKIKNKERGIYSSLKRVLDLLVSVSSLIIVVPIILVTSLLIILESPGNPFYVQKRMGLMGKEFNLIKLRSMRLDAEKKGAQWAEKDDPRITRIGKFIRKTRIDELPQIFNVIRGDMAIIGPRPERKIFVEEFTKTIPNFPKRLEVNPGLTGWAQVNGGYEITPKDKLELDLFYIDNRNVLMDLKIILLTFQVIFTGEGAR